MIDPSAFGNTNVPSPAQDELEARRSSVPAIAPFPKSPAIPRIKPTPQAGGNTGGGGGTDLATLMPLLFLAAAPFIEGSHPGYGLGIAQGVQAHLNQQSQDQHNLIFGMIKEGANLPEEQLPVFAAALKAAGVKPAHINAVMAGIKGGLGRDPDWEIRQVLDKLHKALPSQFAEAAATGQPFDPRTLTPEQFAPVQGLLPNYGVRDVVTGMKPAVPGQPGAFRGTPSEIGTAAAQPIPGTPAQAITQGQVYRRGETPAPQLSDYVGGLRIRQNMDMPAQMLLSTLQGRINAAPPEQQAKILDQAIRQVEGSPLFINRKEDEARFTKRVEAVQKQFEVMVEDGRLQGDVLTRALAAANTALASDARNSGQSFAGLNTNMIAAKMPKPESVVLLNTRTGEAQTLSLPPGTKLHTFSPPNAPQQHLILYPDGRRELLPPGMVPTHAPSAPSLDKVSPADKEVLGIFFNANSYAQLKTRPQAEIDAFAKRFQEAIKNLGVKVPTGPLPPPTDPFWDAIKSWVLQRLGVGEPAPAPGVPRPVAPKPKSPADDPLGILTP